MNRGRGRRRKPGGDDNGFAQWGGYMAAKKAKLQEQFQEDAVKESEREGIFKGVAIYVNGYTDPTADELKRIMMMNGGIFHHYQCAQTTHIIAINLPDTKVKNLKGHEPIVHPKWIVESLSAGKLLNFTNYLLYSNVSSSQPKISFTTVKAKDAKDAQFLGEFYNNSRLHHISTMGANFKDYVNELRNSENVADFSKNRSKLKSSPGFKWNGGGGAHVFMHIDMDCFFVSVGLRNYPHLKGKPVAVTHSKGNASSRNNVQSLEKEMIAYQQRLQSKTDKLGLPSNSSDDKIKAITDSAGISMSEIASCSYEARAKGIKNGMFMGAALKLCPDLQTIPYDFESYQNVAKSLYDTVAQYTLDIQAVSCDEMLVDLTDLIQDVGISPEDFAQVLRQEMHEKTSCKASVGLGSSLLLARMATKKAKPDGVFHLADDQALNFFKKIHVSDLPGVGRTTAFKFKSMGIESCGDLQEKSVNFLKAEFGAKIGQSLFNFARGLDDRQIQLQHERKSVSAEINYGIRFDTVHDMEKFIGQLSAEVASRLDKAGQLKGKQITLKIMVKSANAPEETAKFLGHGLCDSHSKSCQLTNVTNDANVIKRETLILMNSLNVDPKNLRGIGIQMNKLEKIHSSSSAKQSILSFVKKMEPKAGPSNVQHDQSSVSKLDFKSIDESVLNELPEDIRLEIIAERDKDLKLKQNQQKEDLKLEEMSFSQFDTSVLAQLPSNIVEELKQEYGKNQSKKRQQTAFDALMNNQKRLMQDKSPEARKKKGRPSKNSPRFVKKSNKTQPKNDVILPRKALEFQDQQPLKEEPEEKLCLNGLSELKDIRKLFRNWIQSCDEPSLEDVEVVTEFFEKKVQVDDGYVYDALKSLSRLCVEANQDSWSQMYNQIIKKVQEIHKSSHNGKKLYLSFC